MSCCDVCAVGKSQQRLDTKKATSSQPRTGDMHREEV